ncbi:C-C motif chemokine 21-like protein [Labeo rohita]|uniref:C-C motif chemokine 21-like protein n=1 Tax=Labeo rohita TaxID=84645 RepID=A0A498NMW0_LABRO|nr:C-C motif chemokine 21-like protein [Labeo rohita]
METQRILLRSLAVAVVIASVVWTKAAGEDNKVRPSCCKTVSRAEVTDPIISFGMLKENLPCVKAVMFETERGFFCCDWRQPWVKRKIDQFLKDKLKNFKTKQGEFCCDHRQQWVKMKVRVFLFYTEKDKICSDPDARWIPGRLKDLKEIVD